MAEVNVQINGRKYRMACEEGQEAHLEALAQRFDGMVEGFKGSFGEIGDTRLTVMAGIAVLDELSEVESKLKAARAELDEVTRAGEALAEELDGVERRYAKALDDTARRLEVTAGAIDAAGRDES